MGFYRIFCLVIFCQFLHTNLKSQDKLTSEQNEKLTAYLAYLHQQKGFNGEVRISSLNSTLYQKSVGLASIEHKVPISSNAKYNIASISKTFTATLVALAKEEGKLSFDDNASKYLPSLSDDFSSITIHQLLTHTSGLPHNEAIRDYWSVKSRLTLNTEQVISEINDVKLLFEPGTEMAYSSLGYYLLATVLESIYKQGFKQLLETKILLPLNMSSTGSANSLSIIPEMTNGYYMVSDDSLVIAPYRNYSMLKGAGDLYSSSEDLVKWANAMLKGELFYNENQAILFTPKNKFKDESGRQYGYGWFIESSDYLKYSHGGGTWGFSSILGLYPNKKISIIVLSNVSTMPTEALLRNIESIIFDEGFTIPATQTQATSDQSNFDLFAGSYTSESGQMKLEIVKTQSGLFAQMGRNPAFQIYPKSDHEFFGKKIEILLSFKIQEGKVLGLTAERMGQKFEFNKQ